MNCRFRVNAYFLIIVIFMLQIFAFGQRSVDVPWTIDPDGMTGQITKMTTETDLKRKFGEQNFQDQDINLGEGNSENGTVLFPGEPQKFIAIIWNDAQKKISENDFCWWD
jgi:hypothetical protein